MAGLVPAIHVFPWSERLVDTRNKSGHDGREREAVMSQAAEENEDEFQPKIVAFLCKWCSSAGSDLAGVSRLQ